MATVFETLSKVDVNAYTETKGKFTYLGWTHAWAEVKSRFPSASYTILPENYQRDNSCEVRTEVTIEGETLGMWLAVTDFNNKPIQSPSCDHVANSRMRCLTKNLAMHGLGFYIYAGESMPIETAGPAATQEEFEELTRAVAEGGAGLLAFCADAGPEKMEQLFSMAPTGKKSKFKEDVRAKYKEANDAIKHIAEMVGQMAVEERVESVIEAWAELGRLEKELVMGRLSSVDQTRVKDILETNQ